MLLWLTALLAFFASLAVNALTEMFLTNRLPLLGTFVGLQLSHNEGIAFGIVLPGTLQAILIFAALLCVLWLAMRGERTRLSRLGFSLVIGGALANILDRFRDGLVTDYIQVGTFPIFNVADSCITIGAILLMSEIFVERVRRHEG